MALEKACFPDDAWPWLDILAALTFPETVRLKAVLGGRVVGFVIGDRRSRTGVGWIASIGVHPDLRRLGIGRKLLLACEQALAMPRVRLPLRPSHPGALRLYQACGYVEVDRLERYYHNGEGAIVMEKTLAGPASSGVVTEGPLAGPA